MITSTANQQVKNIIQLTKKAKVRKAQGLFIAEGVRMFAEIPAHSREAVYVSESFVQCQEHEQMLDGVIYQMVSDEVFKRMSDTKTPQGILCTAHMPQYSLKDLIHGEHTHLLILENIQDPGNLGTMFRTAEGAGVTGIVMNQTCVDAYAPKTVRSTMGSICRVPFYITENLQETIRELKRRRIRLYAAHLGGEKSYDSFDYRKGTAFLIGSEADGLTDETARLADAYLRIPMAGQLESLNAAMAAGILMYEAQRQRRAFLESRHSGPSAAFSDSRRAE